MADIIASPADDLRRVLLRFKDMGDGTHAEVYYIGGMAGGGLGGTSDATAANQAQEISLLGVLRDSLATAAGQAQLAALLTGVTANQMTEGTLLGSAVEAAPANDTASSGLNGRMQRLAQRLTSLMSQLPTTLGIKAAAASLSVVPASDAIFPVGYVPVLPVPTGVATTALVLKNAAGSLFGLSATAGATAGYLMLVDAATTPAAGAVAPKRVWQLAAGQTLEVGFPMPLKMVSGAVLLFSSTGPYTYTASNAAFMAGECS